MWTWADAARATAGQTGGNWQATGLSIDTRSLQAGDMFIALKDARDGHDFVAEAFAKGASAALVSHIPDGVAGDDPLEMAIGAREHGLEGVSDARFGAGDVHEETQANDAALASSQLEKPVCLFRYCATVSNTF